MLSTVSLFQVHLVHWTRLFWMTLNKHHGINLQPLHKFLTWLKKMGVDLAFFFGFIVPNHLAGAFSKQVFFTSANKVHGKPG